MRYDEAYSIGGVGERRVSELLHSEAPPLGYRVLDDLLLDLCETTAQLDHVIIDRYGVLVVETKVRSGAVIRGKSHERFWTACYPGGKRKRLQNPLLQNDRHREMLHRMLQAFGHNLPVNYVQSVVVFYGSNLDHMKLNDVDSMRVINDKELVDFLRARYEFQPNPGGLADDVDDLVSLLGSVNKRGDREVEARHAEMVERAARRFGLPALASRDSSAPARPAAGPTIFGGSSSRYPDGSHLSTYRARNPIVTWAWRLGVGALAAVFWVWFLVGGGLALTLGYVEQVAPQLASFGFDSVASPSAGTIGTSSPAQTEETAPIDVRLARRRLTERNAALANAVIDPGRPEVSQDGSTTRYTWAMLARNGTNAVTAQKVVLVLDARGAVVSLGLD